jgi:hypothetical protein
LRVLDGVAVNIREPPLDVKREHLTTADVAYKHGTGDLGHHPINKAPIFFTQILVFHIHNRYIANMLTILQSGKCPHLAPFGERLHPGGKP